MKPLRIDFAPPGLARTLYRTPLAAWMLACVALLLCLAAAVAGADLVQRQKAHEQRLAVVQANIVAPAAAPVSAAPPISDTQAVAVNAAVMQLNLPWRALQDAVAAGTPPEVALLALEPDAKKRTLRISAEARTSDEMIDYVARLKREELFSDVVLTHHEINDQDPNRPIRFELDATWSAP